MKKVILDTNIFVAAGFNKKSSSAKIINLVKNDELKFVWNKQTKKETKRILKQIPPISWNDFSTIFNKKDEYKRKVNDNDNQLQQIKDKDDRKFAALAASSGSHLITNDQHLLEVKDKTDLKIMTPKGFINNLI